MPEAYGLQAPAEGLLPWEWVTERLRSARNYWVGSTRPDGRPHCCPVWGVWLDDAVYFSTARATRKGRNLEASRDAVIHLESGDEVVIVEGRVEEVPSDEPVDRVADPYEQKYGLRPPLADPGNVLYALRPTLVLAWRESDFPQSATRWRFEA
jgi:nitroimidazol reductase NimA-like FMN-containing flavoprotein (pyridoxamine 5'-phosphate oxidase superfamily)